MDNNKQPHEPEEDSSINASSSSEKHPDLTNISSKSLQKYCPKCHSQFPSQVNFCFFDGAPLESKTFDTTQLDPSIPSITSQVPKQPFRGFQIEPNHIQNSFIPLELIQATTRLISPSTKQPTNITDIRTFYWAIPAPIQQKNKIRQIFDHVGFSYPNLVSYLVCLILITIIYILWAYSYYDMKNITFQGNIAHLTLLYGSISILMITILLVLPVIALGYTVTTVLQATKADYHLHIDPTLFILNLLLNVIIFQFNGPLPIIMIPGEVKIRGKLPQQKIGRTITWAVVPGLVLSYVALIGSQLDQLTIILGQNALLKNELLSLNLHLLALFGASVYILIMLPIGNALGRLIQYDSKKNYFIILFLSFLLLALVLWTLPK